MTRDDDGELTAEERAAYGRVLARAAPAQDFLTDIDVLVRERDERRRELSQFDCRRTGGPVSDVGGVHCPPGVPCMRCRLEAAEARLAKVDAAAAEMVERVKHLVWLASGAPMLGEEPLT